MIVAICNNHIYANNNRGIIDSLLHQSRIISSQDMAAAEKVLEEAYQMAVDSDYASGVAEATRLFGLLEFFKVNYPKALELFFKSRDLFDEAGDLRGKARAINNVAVLYSYQNMNEKSLEVYQTVLEINQSLNDTAATAGTYNNMANVYRDLGKLETALDLFKKAISLHLESPEDYSRELSRVYNNTGNLLLTLDKPDSAFVYLKKSLELRIKINEVQGIKNSYQGIGKYYVYIEDYQKALEYFIKGYELAKQIKIPYEIESSAYDLYNIYEKLGMYKEAYDALKLYNEMRESAKNTETIQLLTSLELEARFEKEQELQRLIQAERDLKQQQLIERQIRVRNTLIISVLALIIIVYLIFRGYRTKQKHVGILNKQKNEILEKNEELKMSQQEILAQRDEIEKQNSMLEVFNHDLQNANKKMLDSINYAETLQKTILPYDNQLRSFSNDFFILYKPCEIISGDFYWHDRVNGIDIFALADCTGHGVPGALMTMIATGIMKKVILDSNCPDPACALEEIDKEIANTLKQSDDHGHNLDGFDVALLYIDTNNHTITYSGASIPLYFSNGNGIEKFEAEKGSLGGIRRNKNRQFTNKTLKYTTGAKIYMVSDGYYDQMSPSGKKIGKKYFEEVLNIAFKKEIKEQKLLFESAWLNHKMDENQIDDMTLVGIELN